MPCVFTQGDLRRVVKVLSDRDIAIETSPLTQGRGLNLNGHVVVHPESFQM